MFVCVCKLNQIPDFLDVQHDLMLVRLFFVVIVVKQL